MDARLKALTGHVEQHYLQKDIDALAERIKHLADRMDECDVSREQFDEMDMELSSLHEELDELLEKRDGGKS